MLQEMEPRYELSQTTILFADELITPSVLVQLGIEKTCTLCGDQYHLLNKVWLGPFKDVPWGKLVLCLQTVVAHEAKSEQLPVLRVRVVLSEFSA